MDTREIEIYAESTDKGNPEPYYVYGVAGEAGEVVELFKKNLREHGVENFQEQLKGEIGDVMWYLARIANKNGLTLEECWKATVQKLDKRWNEKYYDKTYKFEGK